MKVETLLQQYKNKKDYTKHYEKLYHKLDNIN